MALQDQEQLLATVGLFCGLVLWVCSAGLFGGAGGCLHSAARIDVRERVRDQLVGAFASNLKVVLEP